MECSECRKEMSSEEVYKAISNNGQPQELQTQLPKIGLFTPCLTRRQTNGLSSGACIVIGALLVLVELGQGHTAAAVAAIPICFLLWGFINLTFADRNAPQGSLSRRLAFRNMRIGTQWMLIAILVGAIWYFGR